MFIEARRCSRVAAIVAASAFAIAACGGGAAVRGAGGPSADGERNEALRNERGVTETLHGVQVKDPFRWLEDGDAAEVKAFTDEQNARTRKFLDALSGRDALKREIAELLHVGYVGAPRVMAVRPGLSRYFHVKREGEQNQPTLYVRDKFDAKDRVLLDASSLSQDGTTALDWWYPSWDGKLVAWGMSESGVGLVLVIRDVETEQDLRIASAGRGTPASPGCREQGLLHSR